MRAGADSGLTSTDAIGVLAVDATGKLKEEKAGARSTAKGAGIGAALFLLGPAAIGVRALGGAAGGALRHKGWDWPILTASASARSSPTARQRWAS